MNLFANLDPVFSGGFSLVIGLLVGSFVNVLIYRLPRNKSIVKPRSHCPKCRKTIVWYDNIPLISYLVLRGRCRICKKPIPIRYPIVELMVGLLFLATEVQFGLSPTLMVRDWPFVSILVAVTFIDMEHRIIPDSLSLGGIALGIATSWMAPDPGLRLAIIGAVAGFLIFLGFAWVYYKLSGRVGLGGGDIKLLAMLGAFLGPEGTLTTILISSVVGSILGITWGLSMKKKSVMTLAIPYGPFLVIGALYHYLLAEYLWRPFTIPM